MTARRRSLRSAVAALAAYAALPGSGLAEAAPAESADAGVQTPTDGVASPTANEDADGHTEGPSHRALPTAVVVLPPSPKRPLPDYDGRGKRAATVGEDLLWIPRVLVSPIYLTTEYVIRRPLGFVVSAADRAGVPSYLYDFFLFGPDHKAGILPLLYVDFGFSPSVGLYGFWDDVFARGNDISGHFSVWTSDWIAGSLQDTIHFGGKRSFTIKGAAIRRPDRTYFGPGPNTVQDDISRYGETRFEGSGTFGIPLWRSSQLQAGVGLRSVDLYHGDFDGNPSVEQQAARGLYPLPYGFDIGYTAQFNNMLLALDTRDTKKPGGGSGFRVEAQAEQGSDIRNVPNSGWLRYQGTVGAFLDLTGHDRVISLSATALFADPLQSGGPIPFTELVSLGGNTPVLSALATGTGLMPGFFPGRLVDRSAAIATLHYHWPIWAWLDGSLEASLGDVFGVHLEELRAGLLRFSGALGIQTSMPTGYPIQVLLGIGSETFDHGGQIDSVRFALGTSRF